MLEIEMSFDLAVRSQYIYQNSKLLVPVVYLNSVKTSLWAVWAEHLGIVHSISARDQPGKKQMYHSKRAAKVWFLYQVILGKMNL